MEHGPLMLNRSMKEWSRRHLKFSGDWVSRFTSRSRSRSHSPNVLKMNSAKAFFGSEEGSLNEGELNTYILLLA